MIRLLVLFFSLNSFAFEIINKEKLRTKQYGAFWCWAASAESVFKYYDKDVKQVDFIKKFYGLSLIFPNQMHSPNLGLPDALLMNYASNVSDESITNIIISKKDIDILLRKSYPIIAVYSNHVSVIVGSNNDSFLVMDTDKNTKTDFIWIKKKLMDEAYFRTPSSFFAVFPRSKLSEVRKTLQI